MLIPQNFPFILQQPRPEAGHMTGGGGRCQSLGADLGQPPDYVDTDEGRCLTPLGRYQVGRETHQTSLWHGNAFHINGPLWGESTGYQWILLIKDW